MEDYAAKMALKPDAALREYVTGHAQYREDAVLAALDELRRRGQPAPEDATLRPGLEATVQTQRAEAEAAARASEASRPDNPAVPEEEQPVLYTPGVIVLFSVLFNVIVAGAVLLALNMKRMNRPRAIWGLALFVVVYVVVELLLLGTVLQHYIMNPLLIPMLNLPAILLFVLWFWPRYVGTYQFQSRGWLAPLLVCFLLATALSIGSRYLLEHVPGLTQLMQQRMQELQKQ
jgi:hypothetical protein